MCHVISTDLLREEVGEHASELVVALRRLARRRRSRRRNNTRRTVVVVVVLILGAVALARRGRHRRGRRAVRRSGRGARARRPRAARGELLDPRRVDRAARGEVAGRDDDDQLARRVRRGGRAREEQRHLRVRRVPGRSGSEWVRVENPDVKRRRICAPSGGTCPLWTSCAAGRARRSTKGAWGRATAGGRRGRARSTALRPRIRRPRPRRPSRRSARAADRR